MDVATTETSNNGTTPTPTTNQPEPPKDASENQQKGAPASKKKEKGKNTNTSKRGRAGAKGVVEKEPPSGTRDFYPAEMRTRNWLFNHFKEVARSFAFQVCLTVDSRIYVLEIF